MVAKRHRSASRRRHPGPFSRDQAITDVDRRTREGRFLKTITTELINHLGDATAPQRLIIQAAALKATRMMLLTDQLLAGVPLSAGSDHHALAWLNSMRLDLQAIGLERKGPALGRVPDLVQRIDLVLERHDLGAERDQPRVGFGCARGVSSLGHDLTLMSWVRRGRGVPAAPSVLLCVTTPHNNYIITPLLNYTIASYPIGVAAQWLSDVVAE
jgi:hypothetical protein